ncbi:TRAP transporter substrate-binding protein [Geminicoccaceae bacterium 1502E]|nr:TRAP transporter substrate-binding protein [Geminicoccaceae bacterium 1502E]
MMKRRGILGVIAAAALAAGLGGNAMAADGLEIRLGSISPVEGADYKAAATFAERAAELSDGAIKVTIFPNSSLGTYKEMLEQIRAGALEGIYESMGIVGPWHPLGGLEAVPYLYRDADHFFRVWRSDLGEEVLEALAAESNFRLIGPAFRGFRQMSVNRNVEKVEDLDGMKLRVPAIPAYVEAWRALGVSPTPVAFEEVYTAIQQGVVEGQENPIGLIYDHHFNEVSDYLVLSNHMAETLGFIFNEAWWKELSDGQREILAQAATASADWYRAYTEENEQRMIDALAEKGMTVVRPELDGFVERARTAEIDPAIAPWVEKMRAVE